MIKGNCENCRKRVKLIKKKRMFKPHGQQARLMMVDVCKECDQIVSIPQSSLTTPKQDA